MGNEKYQSFIHAISYYEIFVELFLLKAYTVIDSLTQSYVRFIPTRLLQVVLKRYHSKRG